MKLILTILALCLATGAYADTLSVQVNRDNGAGTEITDSIVLNAANIGAATAAQGAKADSALQSANYTVKNALKAGISNNGSDQVTAINAFLATAVDGDDFYFPAGTYGFSGQIVVPDKMIKIHGDGPHATFFKALGTMTNGIYRAASSSVVYRCELSDFGVLGEKNVSYGIKIEAWKQAKLNRLYIEDVLVEGMTLGQNGTSGAANMFYESQISEIEVYQKTGAWLPDPSLRVDKGVHLLNSASDNDISRVVVAYAKTAGIHDEAYGNNRYSHIHPWGNGTYPMQFGVLAGGAVSISQGEFDTQSVAGVKLSSAYGGVTVTGSQFINGTPTGVIIQDNTPNVFIAGNYYDSSVTTAYTIYGTATKGTNFTFIDKGVAVIPGLSSNTTGNAATATALAANGTNCSAGYYPLGVDAQGNAESCTQATGGGISALTGDVTASGSGSVAATVISGSTTQAGKVQLTDSTASTSTTTAATPNSVKTAYDLAATKAPSTSKYILQDVDASLPNAQALKGMSTGLLKNSFSTGVLSVASHPTDYYASGDSVSLARVSISGSGLSSGTSPIAIFPTVTNASVFNFGGTTQNINATNIGLNLNMGVVPTANITQFIGFDDVPSIKPSGGTSYNVTNLDQSVFQVNLDSAYTGTATYGNAVHIAAPNVNGGSGVITNSRGLLIDDFGTGTAILTGTGKVVHGDDVQAKTFTGTIPTATTYASTTTIDLSAGDSPSVTLTGNPTLAFSNPKAGQWHRLNIVQDGTGSRTVTWPSTGLVCSWRNTSGHTAPTLLTAAGAVDTIVIHTLSTTSAECWTTGNL